MSHKTSGKICTSCGWTTSYNRILYRVGKERKCYFCMFDVVPPSDSTERAKIDLIGGP